MLEVACLVTALILFISFLSRIAETSMLFQLLILRLHLESKRVTSRLRKKSVALPDILTENVGIVKSQLSYISPSAINRIGAKWYSPGR